MTESLGVLIQRAAVASTGALPESTVDALSTWMERIEKWNTRMDLTAARSREELVDLMLVDALILGARIPRDVRLVDVGTGAGAPGLALAVLRPDLHVTLVEPLGKRASFLSTEAGVLGRRDVTIERARGEAMIARAPVGCRRLASDAVARRVAGARHAFGGHRRLRVGPSRQGRCPGSRRMAGGRGAGLPVAPDRGFATGTWVSTRLGAPPSSPNPEPMRRHLTCVPEPREADLRASSPMT